MTAPSATRSGALSVSVPGVFLVLAFVLLILSALGLQVGSLSLSDFGLACVALALLFESLRK